MTRVRSFELRTERAAALDGERHQLVWPMQVRWAHPGDGTTRVRSTLDPWMTRIGPVPSKAVDLIRIAGAAYCADRLSARGRGFTRDFDIVVQVTEVDAWTAEQVERVARLLLRLTGDAWAIRLVQEADTVPEHQAAMDVVRFDRVALLSGGLDSFCGLAVGDCQDERTLYLGHWSNTTVKGSQNSVSRWYRDTHGRPLPYTKAYLTQSGGTKDGTTRTRSLLFLSIAAAHAAAFGAPFVEVPENGYTSLNPPLTRARAGALSTRSTHPWTFHLFNDLMDDLDLPVAVENPYQSLTKGELVAEAAQAEGFTDGVASTLSCSKLDGRVYRSGSAHRNCGLCFSCLVRRASVLAGGLCDDTPYLLTTLGGDALDLLWARRRADVDDVRYAVNRTLTEDDLEGPFPLGFDMDAAVDLCNRALAELRRLPELR